MATPTSVVDLGVRDLGQSGQPRVGEIDLRIPDANFTPGYSLSAESTPGYPLSERHNRSTRRAIPKGEDADALTEEMLGTARASRKLEKTYELQRRRKKTTPTPSFAASEPPSAPRFSAPTGAPAVGPAPGGGIGWIRSASSSIERPALRQAAPGGGIECTPWHAITRPGAAEAGLQWRQTSMMAPSQGPPQPS